jgi:hypothetical protein
MKTTETKKRSFDTRYVAFVDILGFRNIVRRMQKESELFATVRDALKNIRKQAQKFREYRLATRAAIISPPPFSVAPAYRQLFLL